MSARTILVSLPVAIVGAVCAAGLYWGLLNVPESNVLALVLSAALVLLAAVVVGGTTLMVLAQASRVPFGVSARRAPRGLVGFLLGLAIFFALWWITTTVDDLWALHRGEIDAMFLRYIGTASTGWLHATIAWLMWLLRWGVGSAIIVGATAGGMRIGPAATGVFRGLGLALSPVPLVSTIGALLAWRVLWPLAYWRPKGLGTDSTELVFVSAKLGVLFLLAALLVIAVLQVFARATSDRP